MPIKFFVPLPGPFVWTPADKPKRQGPPPVPLHQQGGIGSALSALGALIGTVGILVFCLVLAYHAITT